MKTTFVFFFFLFSLATVAFSQGTKESFIPENWEIIQEASGDLNKDSVNDVAIITEWRGDALEGVRPRHLLILLKDKKTNLYTQSCYAEHVILDGQSGGTMGDPFQSMEIKNNVLIIKFSGGSREKWSTTHRYRLKDGHYFSVIGATYQLEDMGVTNTYDYNVSNGNMVITTKDSRNKANNKTVNKTLKLLPIEVKDFEPDAIWALVGLPDYSYFIKKIQASPTEVGLGDCYHIFFSEQDFGNAELYLDEASYKLWDDITTTDQNDEPIINPAHKNKKFEITYLIKTGTKCEQQGEDDYQLVIGFKQLN